MLVANHSLSLEGGRASHLFYASSDRQNFAGFAVGWHHGPGGSGLLCAADLFLLHRQMLHAENAEDAAHANLAWPSGALGGLLRSRV
jgi:hypothetical protein